MSAVTFRVFGNPRPQGSKTALGKGIMVESAGEGLRTWRSQVAEAVREQVVAGATILTGPVSLTVRFFLPTPKRPRWPVPAKPPDLSKLVRALEDELSGTLITDDRLICHCWSSKAWATDRNPPGAEVTITEVEVA